MKKLTLVMAMIVAIGNVTAIAQKAKNAAPAPAAAATPTKWVLDPAHSTVKFSVSHLTVSEVEGSFKLFSGILESNTADFNNAKVEFSVDVNSINTDNDMRDKHLKGDDFFNAEKFPKMTLSNAVLKKVKANTYVLEADLTIRDVTKKVKFNVTGGSTMVDPWKNTKTGFKATGKISRKAFNLRWNTLTEAGGAVVGDEVSMTINVELALQK
jgi:polyisoprenoid-binding protein YceI